MKKLSIIVSIVALLESCGTTRGVTSGMSKEGRKSYIAEQVFNGLNEMHYTIEVSNMTQRRGGMRTLSGGYELEIKGDTVISYLPYFGDVYYTKTAPYGQVKGLNFTGQIYDYSAVQEKEGEYRIQFKTSTDEDNYYYAIQLFSNGKAYIDVLGENRDGISFAGEMKIAY